MTIGHCLTMLLDELREAGIANPLTERFTLAATWDDLCRLAGEETPDSVGAALEEGFATPDQADLATEPPTAAGWRHDPALNRRRTVSATRREPGKVV